MFANIKTVLNVIYKMKSAVLRCLLFVFVLLLSTNSFACDLSLEENTSAFSVSVTFEFDHTTSHDNSDEQCVNDCCMSFCDCLHNGCSTVMVIAVEEKAPRVYYSDGKYVYLSHFTDPAISQLLRPPIFS